MTTTACATTPPAQRRLILFGRYPVPGHTKTRLIPLLGAVGAAELQRHLTEKSMATLLAAKVAPVQFCYSGGTPVQARRWLGRYPIALIPQSDGHLGRRMQTALTDALDQGCGQVVLVGTDIPRMQTRHIQAAFDALKENDLVLGPSRDGGYWLVGLRRKAPIFDGIAWGSADVLQQTMAAAQREGLSLARIDALDDIDTEADLTARSGDRDWRSPYLSVVMPALNESAHIEAAIERARSTDSEIIVVDGHSRDRTAAVAQAAGARVISARPGRTPQQNAGARNARGKVLLFLHADTCLPENYAALVFDTLMDPKVVAGAFRFKTDYDHWGMRLIEKSVQIRSRLFHLPYGDQALFMSREVFEKAGGFPLVPVAEDLYLVRRLARLGRIGLAPASAITSGRRWRAMGMWRATLINYLIAGGCLAGVAPKYLAPLYRWWIKPKIHRTGDQ
jgi:uncharacterized protein